MNQMCHCPAEEKGLQSVDYLYAPIHYTRRENSSQRWQKHAVASLKAQHTLEHIRIRWYGLACIIGGLLFAGLNATEALELPQYPSMSTLVGVVLLLCLMGGPLGLRALGAAGSGWMGRVGRVGTIISLLGLCSYLVGQLYTSLIDPEMGIFYALGALLSGVGMLPVGIATLLARRLSGWRRFAPILVGLYYMFMIPIQIMFFIIPNGQPSATLLAFWGLAWGLLGYAIFISARAAHDRGRPQMHAVG